ncbi:MAG: apolipoprotein N-acyltransferase [Vulcanimicrobiaceae bacterium]
MESINLRSIVTSVRVREIGVALLAACALAGAFPKFNAAWLAPIGAAGLFWLCGRLSWKRAFLIGWFTGTVFFCITFSWFGYSVGSLLGNFAFATVLVPSLVEGLFFGAAAAAASLAFARVSAPVSPLAAAAAFMALEWVRSIGILAVPFGQLGYSQADTPLAVFAAYVGAFGVTFVVCALGAYLAQALWLRSNRHLLAALAVAVAVWGAAWLAWPARHAAAPGIRVAAIQGNIAQSIKWEKNSLGRAINRYTTLSRAAGAYHPQLVVWPETVMTTNLTGNRSLRLDLQSLARSLRTTLIVGSLDVHAGRVFNASFIYSQNGDPAGVYDKRQMVPFAESFPGKRFLSWIPHSDLISDFETGAEDAVYAAGALRFAPLICWESAFADLAHAQLRSGANLLIISTDDAWCGQTSGPYQHAQIAQLRAIESGTWILRAASTGISGIIAPDGRYVQHTDLDRQAVVLGLVGAPPGAPFARIGPTAIGVAAIVLYLGCLLFGRRHD